jgi:4-amino-4-deoxy-L-arabinose transferase-like glycosyltransferase
LAAIFVLLAFGYSVVNPIYESTDELQHYRYVRYIIETGRLPVQSAQGARIQAHHPPLYYALAALASGWVQTEHTWEYEPEINPYWGYRYFEVSADNKNQYIHLGDEDFPYHGAALAFHIARWVNVVLGAITVWLTYRITRRIFPQRPWLALGAMAVIAFNPQFLYMSGAINNDVIASTTGAALLYVCIDSIEALNTLTDRRAALIGLLLGLALLAKFNLIFMLPVVGLALWMSLQGGTRLLVVRAGFIIAVVAALIAGWWFVRNQMLYGELTGVEQMNAIWGGRDPLRDLPLALQEIPYAWSALWGRFGYGQIPMPDAVYQIIFFVCVFACVGFVIGAIRHRRHNDPFKREQIGLVVVTVLLFAGAVFAYMTISTAGPNGRFFFPALSAFALVIALGLLEWSRTRPALATSMLALAMLSLALYALYGILAPAYARPQLLSASQTERIANRLDVQLGDAVRVLGSAVSRSEARPGDQVTVSVYWQALKPIEQSYAVFVHLIDQDGVIEAQRDTYPGLGNYATLLWPPGRVFVDRYPVHIPETAYAPLDLTIRVGLYERNGERLTARDGDDGVTAGQLILLPHAGDYPNATFINFDDKVALLGYRLDRRSAAPGESITLTTYWQSLGPTDFDYRIFAHAAVAGTDTVWARATDGPVFSTRPLSSWAEGEIVVDERLLTLDPHTPPGVYDLQLGWFGKPSSYRLPILAEDGHWIGTHVDLTRVRVVEP